MMRVYDTTVDVQFAQCPDKWPLWPILPVKHQTKTDPRHGGRLTGIICQSNRTRVLIGVLGITDWETAEALNYPTVQAVFEDWLVD